MSPRKPALGFIFVTLVLDILGIGLIIPILPKLVDQLAEGGISEASHVYGLLAALYSLMQFLFAPLLGSLSDRFGRRPVILASLLGSGLDYFLLAFAPSLAWFFVGRIIAGVTGANFSAATAYIADVSPPEKRAANFGLIGAAFGLGFIIGPAMGGFLGEIGLRVPFFVAGGLTLLNWLYGLIVLPESLKLKNRSQFSWTRANPVGSLLSLRRYPLVLGLSGSHFLIQVAHQVLPSTWVLYTAYRYGWSPAQTGASLAVVGLMAAIMQGGVTRLVVPRLGEMKTAAFSLIVSALAYIGYGLATEGWMLYLIIIAGSLGGLANPAIKGLISNSIGDNEQGQMQGSLSSLTSLAGIIGPPVAAGLFGYFITDAAPFYLPGAAFFLSACLVILAIALAARSAKRARLIKEREEAVASAEV
ncbi:MAG: TCR/Tet family MFS transporter [Verrucomicrobiae bacterium]|nr:TCR/Tet family MFS transporter [Verrucomicrobiae bacterium]